MKRWKESVGALAGLVWLVSLPAAAEPMRSTLSGNVSLKIEAPAASKTDRRKRCGKAWNLALKEYAKSAEQKGTDERRPTGCRRLHYRCFMYDCLGATAGQAPVPGDVCKREPASTQACPLTYQRWIDGWRNAPADKLSLPSKLQIEVHP